MLAFPWRPASLSALPTRGCLLVRVPEKLLSKQIDISQGSDDPRWSPEVPPGLTGSLTKRPTVSVQVSNFSQGRPGPRQFSDRGWGGRGVVGFHSQSTL